ncbi:MAG: hypothetical protein ACTSU4_12430 [Promethearchaeota archaeon]
MSFSNLKKLSEGKNKVYLVLTIWTLIGYIFFEFLPPLVGVIVFLPLMGVCLIFFFASLFSRKKVHEFTTKRIIFHLIIALPFIVLLVYIGIYLFYVAFVSYMIITAFFTVYSFYRLGVKVHETIEKFPKVLKEIAKWSVFLGGCIISVILIFATAFILINLLGYTIDENQFNVYGVALFLVIIIILLTVIALIVNMRGILNTWIGVFFLGVAIYAAYQMYSISSNLQPDTGTGQPLAVQLILFFGNLLLLLNSFGNLLGEQSEFLKNKLKIFGWDTVLLWLMFSTASYRFAEGLPGIEASLFKSIVVFLLFIPLTFFLGIYGMNFYIKKDREQKAKPAESALEMAQPEESLEEP